MEGFKKCVSAIKKNCNRHTHCLASVSVRLATNILFVSVTSTKSNSMPQQLYFDVVTAAIDASAQLLIRIRRHAGTETESPSEPRGTSDEYDSHVCRSGTVINYLRCFKASW